MTCRFRFGPRIRQLVPRSQQERIRVTIREIVCAHHQFRDVNLPRSFTFRNMRIVFGEIACL